MTTAHRFKRGAAPRHLELARVAIARASRGDEPLDWSIARAIDAAVAEATGVAVLSADERMGTMARGLMVLRARGSLTPAELQRFMGARYASQSQAILHRLVRAGYAKRTGWGHYAPVALADQRPFVPTRTGRPRTFVHANPT
jgi:hypothetical protein